MKAVAVSLLVLGMLCNSMLAMAEGPVPFSALMQTAGADPGAPPITYAKDQSAVVSTQTAHSQHMTSEGKVMTGSGIGMLAIGGVTIIATAMLHGWASPSKQSALYAAGGGLAAGGVTLIVFGSHRRSAE
jgi:hypothetical protein